MKRMTKRSSIIAAVTVVGVFAAGGVAFAYWTTSGSNTTTAGVAADVSSALTVTPTGTISGLFPGGTPQNVQVIVENPSTTAVRLSDVNVTVDSTDKVGCPAGDFAITTAGFAPQTLAPGAVTSALTVRKIQLVETGGNQDACKGATVSLTLTAS